MHGDGSGRIAQFSDEIVGIAAIIRLRKFDGAAVRKKSETLDEQARNEAVMTIVRSTFKPEFLNRLDDFIVFESLTTEQLTQIVDLQVERLGRRLADRRLTLSVTPAAREWLALTGFDPVYGARPLRRLIQSAIGDQLARKLLAGQIEIAGAAARAQEGHRHWQDFVGRAAAGVAALLVLVLAARRFVRRRSSSAKGA